MKCPVEVAVIDFRKCRNLMCATSGCQLRGIQPTDDNATGIIFDALEWDCQERADVVYPIISLALTSNSPYLPRLY